MGITYQKEKQIFNLHTENTTYQFLVDKYGFLLHLYYGKRINGDMDYLLTYYDRGFSGNPSDTGADRTYSMDALPQEFPCPGTGDYRSTAVAVRNADGSYSCDLRFQRYEICKGKYSLEGLPAVYAKDEEAETLKIYLEDPVTKVQAVLLYGVLPEKDIITRSVQIINQNEEKIELIRAASACLDFVAGDYDLITFYGRHAMERNFQRVPVKHGKQMIGSKRGSSSHQYNPSLILADSGTDEKNGGCYGMAFVYSGGFEAEAEKDQFNQTRVMMGLSSDQFCYPLGKGEMFTVPETVMTYSSEGFGGLSWNFHRCFRRNLCRGKYRTKQRPVLVNSWEADYFDFTGETLVALAEHAAELGIDMFVLDDGWFGKRDDDNSGLGDWHVNEEKLGCTMGELIGKINDLGLKFGLWIEPEMVSEDSDLYRQHPDWVMAIPGRKPVRARNQLVLDFSRKEVREEVFRQISHVLDQGNVEYIKWDMNRSLADIYSSVTKDQGKVLYDYVLGVYDFLEKLTEKYPDILIEGCSGGGGRFDAGMLYYTPQIWCSDNTDAVDRLDIQYGTSFIYPISCIGSHVSAVPNHQTGRVTSLHTRGVVAMAGTFGYELNLGILPKEEKEEIKQQIKTFKKHEGLIHNGRYYRLSSPQTDEIGAWAFVSEEREEVLVNVVMLAMHGNMTVNYVKLQGLDPDGIYEDENGRRYDGVGLMEAGIPLPIVAGTYPAWQIYLRLVKEENENSDAK
ncbi:alpha-galactosidase [Sellimonas sp.]|uniref:alpha-galactosidase n=1 Tax=Sellimonas sp. TaxID=2021466 RepID=UPI00257AA749|nr:alpha-galactosidase [Sellimonas sp.]